LKQGLTFIGQDAFELMILMSQSSSAGITCVFLYMWYWV
jgi:hypothetical protein